jgi:hypothetical protein
VGESGYRLAVELWINAPFIFIKGSQNAKDAKVWQRYEWHRILNNSYASVLTTKDQRGILVGQIGFAMTYTGGTNTSLPLEQRKLRDHLQIIRSKSETTRNGFSVLFDFKIHNLKRFIHNRNVSPCKRISVMKIRFTLKLQKSVTKSFCKKSVPFYKRYRFNSFYTEIAKKSVTKSFRKKSVPFYKHYRFVSAPFDIRYGWIYELGNIGTAKCTVFKYVSLQKCYPKLLIKLGTDFEVGQKRKTVPFHF